MIDVLPMPSLPTSGLVFRFRHLDEVNGSALCF